ncbi:MAG: hypothetical protein HC925_01510 [Coleofasciculaceae cyanobacterium SM2_3_26]|nr:hypothetical protein [Coleofasciculaceae cyanobacterium SM2_3_26]
MESFDVEAQVQAFIQVMPKLMERSPEWTAILHSRIANDAIARSVFEEQSGSSGGSRHQKNLLDLAGQVQFTPDCDRKALRETRQVADE